MLTDREDAGLVAGSKVGIRTSDVVGAEVVVAVGTVVAIAEGVGSRMDEGDSAVVAEVVEVGAEAGGSREATRRSLKK